MSMHNYPTRDSRLLPMSSIHRAIELPEDDRFSTEPAILFEQATNVVAMPILLHEGVAEDDYLKLLLFVRQTESNGQADGVEVAAYECDGAGRVKDWSKRYRVLERNLETVRRKLSYAIVNGLIETTHIENEVGGHWTIDLKPNIIN